MVSPALKEVFKSLFYPLLLIVGFLGFFITIISILYRNEAQQSLIEQLRTGLAAKSSSSASVCPSISAAPATAPSVEMVPVARALDVAACPCWKGQSCSFLDSRKNIRINCEWKSVHKVETWVDGPDPAASASAGHP